MVISPSSYRADPWGWIGNQCGHAVVGFVAMMALTYTYHAQFKEMPHRECLIATMAIGYIVFELISQGWQGWDTIEDWAFFTIYGVAAPVLASTEAVIGSATLLVDISVIWPFMATFIAHCAIGFGIRSWQARSNVG